MTKTFIKAGTLLLVLLVSFWTISLFLEGRWGWGLVIGFGNVSWLGVYRQRRWKNHSIWTSIDGDTTAVWFWTADQARRAFDYLRMDLIKQYEEAGWQRTMDDAGNIRFYPNEDA